MPAFAAYLQVDPRHLDEQGTLTTEAMSRCRVTLSTQLGRVSYADWVGWDQVGELVFTYLDSFGLPVYEELLSYVRPTGASYRETLVFGVLEQRMFRQHREPVGDFLKISLD